MTSQLQLEITRLKELKKVNPSVRQAEIDLLVGQRREMEEHMANARIRLDAIRVGGRIRSGAETGVGALRI